MAENDLTIKIIFLGDFVVNKGALLRALGALSPTPQVWCMVPRRAGLLEMMFVRPDEKKVRAKIQDTAGQERFRSITSSFYRGAHGCILFFDVTNKATFDGLNEWVQEFRRNSHSEDVVAALAGCNSHVTGIRRQVAFTAAKGFADHQGFLYQEISVEHIFTLVDLLEKMIDRILLNASRLPLLSISILPLDQKMEERSRREAKQKCAC